MKREVAQREVPSQALGEDNMTMRKNARDTRKCAPGFIESLRGINEKEEKQCRNLD